MTPGANDLRDDRAVGYNDCYAIFLVFNLYFSGRSSNSSSIDLIVLYSIVSFFASTLFNRTGLALAIGGGIPFAFFLLTMVQQLMDDAPVILKYLTITTLFDTDAILASGEFGWGLVALGTIAFVLYAASNVIFTKKDLPL